MCLTLAPTVYFLTSHRSAMKAFFSTIALVVCLTAWGTLAGMQQAPEGSATQSQNNRHATAERPQAGGFDGPAELPRATVDVTLPQQTGKTIRVRANDNFQEALERASCGDTIQLEAGATFTGT